MCARVAGGKRLNDDPGWRKIGGVRARRGHSRLGAQVGSLRLGAGLVSLLLMSVCAQARIPVVLSTDVGNEIDDQWAIVYLLAQPEFDVRGILSAHAPSLPDPSAHASYLILKDAVEHRMGLVAHPPLLEGSSLPLADRSTPRPSAAATFLLHEAKSFTPENRLTVVVIGAATDVSSALLMDPTLADRIRVVAMALKDFSPNGAHEYNEENDPRAWQVLLASRVPLAVGTGETCQRYLSLTYTEARAMLAGHGPVAEWLWSEYQVWYYRQVKPLRVPDFSKPWVIWDVITLAYLRGLATATTLPRPMLDDTSTLRPGAPGATIERITAVDTQRFWAEFLDTLDRFEETHRTGSPPPLWDEAP